MTGKRFVVENYSVRDKSVDTKYINSYYHIGDNGVAKRICDLLNELHEEIEYLKPLANENTQYIDDMEDDIITFKQKIEKLEEDKEQLKQSFTMYYNLFVEFQKQMKGVKKASDLDSKDFEDLIKLAKGNVFDDEIGWIHLPVKELEE